MKLATPKQVNYLSKLVSTRVGRALTEEELTRAQALTRAAASNLIDAELERMKDAPNPNRFEHTAELVSVPAGYYALRDPNGEDEADISFYRVEYGRTATKWEGHVFVSRFHGDNLRPVLHLERAEVLERISRDPAAASMLYGERIGKCGVCGKTLTDPESRAQGIGPVCRQKQGW